MTILIFLAVLFVLILVHELGHFAVAKWSNMRVDEFGIGFPPKLFGIKKGETEYTINALPIGGFVKIFGEDAQDAAQVKEGGGTVEDSFTSKSRSVQALVLVAGVIMNILFAWLLFVVVFVMGVPTSVDESEASADARLVITSVLDESPAQEVGIPTGAVLTSVQTADATLNELTPTAFRSFAIEHPSEEIMLTYMVGSEETDISLTPESGIVPDSPEQPAIGVALTLVETISRPVHQALWSATVRTYESLIAVTIGISTLIFDSLKLQADFSNIAGPVGIVSLVGDAAEFGFTSLLLFTAIISLNLAVINLLPFPALDGGRLLFVAIEAVIRRPINPKWVLRLNTAGFMLLMLLMVAVTYNDVLRLL